MGFADGGDEDVGAAAEAGEVAAAAVGHGDGGVAPGALGHEEQREGLAHDHAAPQHHDARAFGGDVVFEEEALAAQGGAGDEAARVLEGELGDVFGVEAVDVLAGVDGADDGGFVDVAGRRALHQDAVDGGVGVELADHGEQFLLAGGGGQG